MRLGVHVVLQGHHPSISRMQARGQDQKISVGYTVSMRPREARSEENQQTLRKQKQSDLTWRLRGNEKMTLKF